MRNCSNDDQNEKDDDDYYHQFMSFLSTYKYRDLYPYNLIKFFGANSPLFAFISFSFA